ncbi:MAG: hypothetical protein UT18_C0010G0036 [candidate division CPR2 bacterium GW2011_GWC2_39_10]|uniref:DUF4330 domain-containing protein n=1 Tax=candidate division CPR2 bacterium GW2011_GWC2_39_10 TaxID=1618345 RepID=A0A0G0P8J6_UNCC2|nr:MAG: hypothetical protein UT18_C0010G0036 [candidate division CPR2 bacterium GW2011_GWC2_39_10]
MKTKKYKFNIIDLILGSIIILFLAVMVIGKLVPKEADSGKSVLVTVRIPYTDSSSVIYNEARKLGDVYFNSTLKPVRAMKVEKSVDKSSHLEVLDITIMGSGRIENDRIVFNGTRILIGQKAEIHANYFAQGVISNVQYEN